MKSLLFTLTFLSLFPTLHAQSYPPPAERQFKSLVGTIYILPFFLDRDTLVWTKEEVETCLSDLKSSEDWIMGQATRYHVKLEFLDDFVASKDAEIMIDNAVRDLGNKNLLKITMEQLGYENYDTYLRFNGLNVSKQQVYVVFFMKAPRTMSHDRNPSDNCTMISYDPYSRNMMYPNVIAHELLHLFGAWDLYHEQFGLTLSKELSDKAARLYPKSVMNCRTCQQLQIDELTAWVIGWNSNYKAEFQEFSPKNYKR